MSMYTCNCCSIQFEAGEAQRSHMKSDWHRYNLKRRVANLPPTAEDVFLSKLQAMKNAETEDEISKKKQLTKKELRRREKEALLEKKKQLLQLAEENARKNMLLKQQELQTAQHESRQLAVENVNDKEKKVPDEVPSTPKTTLNSEEDKDVELTEEQVAEKLMKQKIANRVDIPLTECFFCSKKFDTIENNLEHMFKNHGFYIPEKKYLVNRDGLLEYIAEKIGLGNICLVCNYQGRSLEAVRAHMLAKRHCKIPYENEDEQLEISQFYDFTSSYQGFNATAENSNDEDWEDVDSAEEGNDEEEEEEEVTQENLYHDGVELHLPTGIKIGHRSLQRYYKQNLKPEMILSEGQGTLVAADTRSFLTTFDKKDVQVQQRVWQTEIKDKKRHDKRAAKFINNQPHYRDQLLQ